MPFCRRYMMNEDKKRDFLLGFLVTLAAFGTIAATLLIILNI